MEDFKYKYVHNRRFLSNLIPRNCCQILTFIPSQKMRYSPLDDSGQIKQVSTAPMTDTICGSPFPPSFTLFFDLSTSKLLCQLLLTWVSCLLSFIVVWFSVFELTVGTGQTRLAVWLSGNALVSINLVTLRRARLVPGWVIAFGRVNCLGM